MLHVAYGVYCAMQQAESGCLIPRCHMWCMVYTAWYMHHAKGFVWLCGVRMLHLTQGVYCMDMRHAMGLVWLHEA